MKIIIAALLCTFAMGNGRVMAQTEIITKQEENAIKARVKEIVKDGWQALEQEDLVKQITIHATLKKSNKKLRETYGQVRTSDLRQGLDVAKAKTKKNAAIFLADISTTIYIDFFLRYR